MLYYGAKEADISMQCKAHLFFYDNLVAVVAGMVAACFLFFKGCKLYRRCSMRRKAQAVYHSVVDSLEEGRLAEDDVNEMCQGEGVMDEVERLLRKDKEIQRFQKLVDGRATTFLERRGH